MNQQHRMRPLALAVCAVLGLAGSACAIAQTPQELETRIQQLEAQIKELKALVEAQSKPVAAAPAPAAAPGAPPPPPPIQATTITPNSAPGTKFSFTGFVKTDAMYSSYSDGEIADGSIGRDFYVPGTIPVGGADEGADLDAHVKQSRFIFGTDTTTADNKLIQTRLEFDLFGSALGDERITNTYGLQLRHAYLNYNNQWLIGETWSNFQDVGALPEAVDFIGPVEGTVFVRQPQLRYTSGPISVSLENPETTITPFRGGARISSDDNNLPDLSLRYTHKWATGSYITAAGLLRQLAYETTGANGVDDSTIAAAFSISGKVMFGKDDLRWMINTGALGRYTGLNLNNDAVLDASGDLDAISGTAGFIGFRHLFNDQLRSNIYYARAEYDNDTALGGTAQTESTQSLHLNLFYSPIPKWDVGAELTFAKRELESGAEGKLRRLQATVKYAF